MPLKWRVHRPDLIPGRRRSRYDKLGLSVTLMVTVIGDYLT